MLSGNRGSSVEVHHAGSLSMSLLFADICMLLQIQARLSGWKASQHPVVDQRFELIRFRAHAAFSHMPNAYSYKNAQHLPDIGWYTSRGNTIYVLFR
jgi:hypothetical protein